MGQRLHHKSLSVESRPKFSLALSELSSHSGPQCAPVRLAMDKDFSRKRYQLNSGFNYNTGERARDWWHVCDDWMFDKSNNRVLLIQRDSFSIILKSGFITDASINYNLHSFRSNIVVTMWLHCRDRDASPTRSWRALNGANDPRLAVAIEALSRSSPSPKRVHTVIEFSNNLLRNLLSVRSHCDAYCVLVTLCLTLVSFLPSQDVSSGPKNSIWI